MKEAASLKATRCLCVSLSAPRPFITIPKLMRTTKDYKPCIQDRDSRVGQLRRPGRHPVQVVGKMKPELLEKSAQSLSGSGVNEVFIGHGHLYPFICLECSLYLNPTCVPPPI